jgi:hypothetical protein
VLLPTAAAEPLCSSAIPSLGYLFNEQTGH